MAVKIPQNIDKEDKLVGPLTLKQFLYLLGGSGIGFIVYQYHLQGYLFFYEFIMIAILILLLSLSFAFVKINGFPFVTFIVHVFSFLFSSKKSLWRKDNQTWEEKIKVQPSKLTANKSSKDAPDKSHLEELARVLDTGGKINTELPLDDHAVSNIATNDFDPEKLESDLNIEDVLDDTNL
ncbi:PrgI family protein [Patescibacteria group bacterium]|nr:PrgI family protein [Patescibacteria group bacterium]